MTPIKHIIFDWNGTLFDDAAIVLATVNRILSDLERPSIGMPDFHRHYCMPFRKFYYNLGITEAEAAKLVGVFDKHYEPRALEAGLRPGAMDILAFAHSHGAQKIILSNHITEAIQAQLLRLGIGHYFGDVLAYSARDSQNRSPGKGERLCRYMTEKNYATDATVIIGDSPEEIEIARDLGLVGVAITGGCTSEEQLRAAKPDHLIHSLADLKPILEERRVAA